MPIKISPDVAICLNHWKEHRLLRTKSCWAASLRRRQWRQHRGIQMKHRLWWISKDGQSSIFRGEYAIRQAAEVEISAAKKELLGLCSNGDEKADMAAGSFEVETCPDHLPES